MNWTTMPPTTRKTPGVCAVVVTCNPQASLARNVEQLGREIAAIIVVDNSTVAGAEDLLRQLEQRPGLNVIRNRTNIGIAAALNVGIRHAIAEGFEWVATFDQDSTIMPGYFAAMLAAYEACACRTQVPLIAPRLCDSDEESAANRRRGPGTVFSLTRTAMSSGSLIKTEIFATEGLYDEAFFMDYVDYDFCLRLGKHGWKLIRANQAHLLHRLGSLEAHSLLGLRVLIKSHSPWRRYYIMRNRLVVFRRYAFSSPAWCAHDLAWIFLELAKIVLFESEKSAKLLNVMKGLSHGLRGKLGKRVQPFP